MQGQAISGSLAECICCLVLNGLQATNAFDIYKCWAKPERRLFHDTQNLHEIQSSVPAGQAGLEPSQGPSRAYCLRRSPRDRDSLWYAKLKIFTMWLFAEQADCPAFCFVFELRKDDLVGQPRTDWAGGGGVRRANSQELPLWGRHRQRGSGESHPTPSRASG